MPSELNEQNARRLQEFKQNACQSPDQKPVGWRTIRKRVWLAVIASGVAVYALIGAAVAGFIYWINR